MRTFFRRHWYSIPLAVFGLLVYLWNSSPHGIVVSQDGKITGLFNRAREVLQGKRFWADQREIILNELKKEIKYEESWPDQAQAVQQIMDESTTETNRVMEELYRKNPSMRPSQSEQQVQALRSLADRIEFSEMLRLQSKARGEHIAELNVMLGIVTARAQE